MVKRLLPLSPLIYLTLLVLAYILTPEWLQAWHVNVGNLWVHRGITRDDTAMLRQAVVTLEMEVQSGRAGVVAERNLGHWLLLTEGDDAEAAKHLERAIELGDCSGLTHLRLGDIYLRLGRSGDAIQQYLALGYAFPHRYELVRRVENAYWRTVHTAWQTGNAEDAQRWLMEWLKINPNSFGAHYYAANLGAQDGLGALTRASSWSNSEVMRLIDYLLWQDMGEEAADLIEALPEDAPERLYWSGRLAIARGQWDVAIGFLRRFLTGEGADKAAELYLACAYSQKGSSQPGLSGDAFQMKNEKIIARALGVEPDEVRLGPGLLRGGDFVGTTWEAAWQWNIFFGGEVAGKIYGGHVCGRAG